LPKKHACRGLTCRIGQGGGDMADQTRVLLADVDLDPHKSLACHPRSVTGQRGPGSAAHPRYLLFPEILPENSIDGKPGGRWPPAMIRPFRMPF
jgi:hypothetical protein